MKSFVEMAEPVKACSAFWGTGGMSRNVSLLGGARSEEARKGSPFCNQNLLVRIHSHIRALDVERSPCS